MINQVLLEKFGREYSAGDVIFCEFEDGNECFVIHSGEVSIIKVSEETEKTLAVLKPGDIFGEMGVLEGKPRTATAFALTDVTVLALNMAGLQALVTSQPAFAANLGRILASRIVESYRHLQNLSIDSPRLRVVDLLLWKVQEPAPGQFMTPLSPRDLAEFSGLSQDDVDKVLDEFSTLGRVRVLMNKVEIVDIRSLRRLIRPGGER